MSPMWIKFISALVMNFLPILVAKKLLNSNIKLVSLKTIFWVLIASSTIIFFYVDNYDFTTLLMFSILVLGVKKIYNTDITKAFVTVFYSMIISILPDIFYVSIIIYIFNLDAIYSSLALSLLSNLLVLITTYYLILMPSLKKILVNSINKLDIPKRRSVLIFTIFSFLALCIVYYTIAYNLFPSEEYFMSNIVALIFVFLVFVYITEILKYDKLEMKNKVLFDCMNNIEIYQEQQDLKIHEYKNQLSKITSVTKDKKVLGIVEDILQIDLNEDHYILGQLQYIPKGELKSLIYYKLLVANKQGIKPLVEASNKLVEKDFDIINKHSKEITQLIGIYFDNAIEAAMKSKKKILSFEIYKVKGDLNIVISNTYKESVDLNRISEKGVSTKGIGRGKGLYFAKKIVNNAKYLESENKLSKGFYIQKLTIKKDCN